MNASSPSRSTITHPTAASAAIVTDAAVSDSGASNGIHPTGSPCAAALPPQKKRKYKKRNEGVTIKKEKRKLSPLEMENSLKEAKGRGLPDGWTVTYDNKQQRKLWISPHNGKACKSIPEALAQSGVKPFSKTELTEKERLRTVNKAKSKGLPEGWTVSWDSRRRRTIWLAPDGVTTCDSIPEALQHSGISGTKKRQLSKEEIEEAMEEAKKRGLPSGWTVSWDNKARRRRWISPDGKIAKGVPEAMAMASQRALTATEVAEQVKTTTSTNGANSNPLAMLADVGRLLSMPANPPPQKELTPFEEQQALKKARERGLPHDWTVKCNKWGNKKVWISPEGKQCNSIPEALQVAGMATAPDHCLPNFIAKTMTQQELDAATTKAREAGLPKDWTIEAVTRKRQKVYVSPQGRKVKGLMGALEMAGVIPPKEETKKPTSPQDIKHTLQMAKERGLLLENGWTVFNHAKRRQKLWISPQGDIYDSPPSPEAIATAATSTSQPATTASESPTNAASVITRAYGI